jgi:hypothetical protein
MRILLLSSLFLLAIYYIYPRVPQGPATDVVRSQLSAVKRTRQAPGKQAPKRPVITSFHPTEIEPSAPAHEVIEHRDRAPAEQLESWQRDIREYLIKAEPEEGEEMFHSFLSEKAAFRHEQRELVEEKEGLYRDHEGKLTDALYQKNLMAIQEYDLYLEQLTLKHEERLRQILGIYYDEVAIHHDQSHNPTTHYAEPVLQSFDAF